MIDKIINLKELRKYIVKNYGERCKEHYDFCETCREWERYDFIEQFVKDDMSNERWEKTYASEN